ncbi:MULTISPECIES: amidohydrolase family protein [unclassified Streptomyces]|uniref:amidohydrolase family protein n=1 Tax=unclassified Streptomyces TaxID=2593676 RepID=UPI00081D8472|nr:MULTISPECIES: amidohydrolase family protein [unclassified Streptomyces]MYZ38280.1 amidohydrolase family protein [Streptomyces sp. SID4917]SCF97508.1 Amidohydrolase family protein [Streptomyces sp. MnatMP-M17]
MTTRAVPSVSEANRDLTGGHGYMGAEWEPSVEEATARGTYVTVHAHNNDGIRNAVAAGARCVEHGSRIDERTAALMAQHGVAHVPTLSVVQVLLDDASEAGLPAGTAGRVGHALRGQTDAPGARLAALRSPHRFHRECPAIAHRTAGHGGPPPSRATLLSVCWRLGGLGP